MGLDNGEAILVELCAGSAALTRHFRKIPKLVGFQGAKDRYVDQILAAWPCPTPDVIHLNDPGYWGDIWESLCRDSFKQVAGIISAWQDHDARELFDGLNSRRDEFWGYVQSDAAAKLCLLASTHGGGEIGGFKGRHKLRPSVDGFIPSRQSLVKRLLSCPKPERMFASSVCAKEFEPIPGSWVYIDPPYEGTTGYRNKLGRGDVLNIARRWREAGCNVAVSEAEPLCGDLGAGWMSIELRTTSGQARKNARVKSEFITVWSGE